MQNLFLALLKGFMKTFLSRAGNRLPIPTRTSSKKEILTYIEAFIPYTNFSELGELWDLYMKKKKSIISYLEIVRDGYYAKGEKGKVHGYNRAISVIKKLKIPIVSGNQAMKYKGIGPKIGRKIDEILDTSALEKAKEIGEEEIKIFTDIWGIGPAKARSLYNKGFRSVKQLQNDKQAQMELLSLNERVGLEFYDYLKLKIPHSDITSIRMKLRKLAIEVDNKMRFCICGSYRRKVPYSGDIDILISSKMESDVLGKYVNLLYRENIVIRTLALGKKKFMGIARIKGIPRRLDIRFIKPESWGPAVLYFTGSKEFNILIRQEAKEKGFKLNEYHLKKGDKIIPINNERDIFKALGLPYFSPEYRVDHATPIV